MMGIHKIMKDYQEVWIWKRNNGSETNYGFAEKKMMGIHNIMKDYQEVWIWKKMMVLRGSMDLQKKKDGYL